MIIQEEEEQFTSDSAAKHFTPYQMDLIDRNPHSFRPSKDDHAYIRVDEIDTKDEILLHHVDSKSTTE